jgi:glycosyltransferase involved in cell wall biosynthesis
VLSQTHKKFEIIVVNDGSSDDSLSVVENSYPIEINKKLIKIIDQNNQGVSIARNNGIAASQSNYICFLDADDEWEPSFLEKMAALIIDFPNADTYSLAHMVKKEGIGLIKPKHGLTDGYRGYVKDFFKASSRGSVVKSSKVCVKKQALLIFGGFPEGVVAGEDLYVWIRLALNGKVACDMSFSVIVHQEEDQSRYSRKNSVPYPFTFLSKNKYVKKNKSLNKYLFVIFYKHFLSSLSNFKLKEASFRLYYYLRMYL